MHNARFLLGDCFMTADEDYANERLEAMKEEKEQEVSDLKAKLDNISSRQAELKSTLYARFGNSINLEA